MSTTVVLPGQPLPSSAPALPAPPSNKTLTLGPGLRHVPPSTVLPTIAGELCTDTRKNAVWVESSSGRYLPHVGDLVIANVHHSSTDTYHCSLTPHTPFVLLAQLSFEGATKKTRPQLGTGSLVYARVSKAEKWADVEIECVNPATAKADGMGPLKGGMVFDVSLALARRLMMGRKGGVLVLDEVGEKVRFEVAVGRNGRVWVDSGSIRETVAIGKILREVDDKDPDVEAQRKLVKKALRDL
ncbi:exosome non-catalytic core subunit rrp40 [Taxawa tesnikishii (nom. ined.)]|nr:exosome non-catalytic core subunit rrp40 [Dothideales sp. JES 119]